MGRNSHAGAETYARLRRVGVLYLPQDQAGRVGNLRRLAKIDGLRVVASLPSGARMSPSQRRNRKYEVALCTPDDFTVVRPDACHCMTEDPGDGYGERVVEHSGGCHLHPESDL